MGKIIASYLVRVTLREPESEDGAVGQPPPTNAEVAQAVKEAIAEAGAGDVSVSSERLDA